MNLIDKTNLFIEGEKIDLRIITEDDFESYYQIGFATFDKEAEKCTGTKDKFTKEQIQSYVSRIVKEKLRYDFLILDKSGNIIGESVLNEMDEELNSCNFRICLFSSANFSRGLGGEAVKLTVKFAFEELALHRVELDVFSFNERAYRSYKKAGFIEEGRKRDAEIIDGEYCDVIFMSILESDYKS